MPRNRLPAPRRLARDLAEQVLRRAEHLPVRDRSLLKAVYADGRTVKDIASLTREDPRRLRRHVRRLTHRILSSAFVFVVAHKDSWPTSRRRIATACILHGRTLKEAAADSGTSFYNARKQLDVVRALLDSIDDLARRPPPAAGADASVAGAPAPNTPSSPSH